MRFTGFLRCTMRCTNTPGIYVDRVILGERYEKKIERLTTRPRQEVA